MLEIKKIFSMKLKQLLFGMIIYVIMTSCVQPKKNSGEEETVYKSQSYKLVENNIMDMANSSWNKTSFIEIRDNQIPMLKKNSERISATTLLETEYSKLLVRDAKSILESGCPENNSHNLLNQLLAELKTFPKVPGLSDVISLKKVHDDAYRFTQTAVGRQLVNNYRTPYNDRYETMKIAEAIEYLDNSKVKCKSLRAKLNNLTKISAYSSRRYAYCKAIVNSYLQCTDPAKSELNAAKANLSICSGYSSTWKDDMDKHYNELNEKDENK